MKFRLIVFTLIVVLTYFILAHSVGNHCMTGAFLSDSPSASDIENFKSTYGKNPLLVMVFVDWNEFVSQDVINAVYGEGCVLLVSWEPQNAENKEPIDYDGFVSGKYDKYISEFATRLKNFPGPVFLRFAHEANGNWYPWSASVIGSEKYKAIYRRAKDIFDKSGAEKVKWIFSINWENVPKENKYQLCYPGNSYVDYIGIDGYNWGDAASWSKWRSFKEVFSEAYNDASRHYKKPVLITEFSSSTSGGDKKEWIKQAFSEMKRMKNMKGFVIFLVNKETDWGIEPRSGISVEMREQLKSPYFTEDKRRI